MALIDLVGTSVAEGLTGTIASTATTAATEPAVAEWFGSGHLIALILMPLLAVVTSLVGGWLVLKAVPEAH